MPISALGFDYHSLASAVAVAESNSQTLAVGDGGKARGAYQMWKIAWTQVNSIRKSSDLKTYSWDYAHDPYVSRIYATQYLRWCGSVLERELGRPPAFWEVYAAYARGPTEFRSIGHSYSALPARTKRAIGIIAAQLHEPAPR